MADAAPQTESPPRKPRRKRRWLLRALVCVVLLLIAFELFCRLYLGLGDPPLIMPDPQIEYLHRPSTSYRRFGHAVAFNAYSMRSPDFAARKSDHNESRVMVLGDSIINGGGHTDQTELATELLRTRLQAEWNRPIVVGNISAGSWGPANLLAYANKYGLFDADFVVIVLGSQDAGDIPSFDLSGTDSPTRKPLLASIEFAQRYAPALLRFFASGRKVDVAPTPTGEQIEESLDALRQLIDLSRSRGAMVAAVLHWERTELTDNMPHAGMNDIRRTLEKRDVPIIDMHDRLRDSILAGREPFRDYTHPNAVGQQLMCDAIAEWMNQHRPPPHGSG